MKKALYLGYLIAGLLIAGGIWQTGAGAYVYAKAILAQYLLHAAWERTLEGEIRATPWAWSDTWPVARLRVDRLGVDQIVLAGASGRSLAFGAGHVMGTAPPGQSGNSVISGHRDTHFRFLKNLQAGDRIQVILPNGLTRHYAVQYLGVHHQDDTNLLSPGEDHRLTLITCYPFYAVTPGGPLRFVVIANHESQF